MVKRRSGARDAGDLRARWQARVRRFDESGSTVAAFCKAEGISAWSFYDWRRKLATAAGTARRRVGKEADEFVDAGPLRLAVAQGRGAPASLPAAIELRIEVGGALVLQILRR
jgi:hypothetical protein